MKISNNPPQHLANYEVLQHFLALKEDNDWLQEAALDKKNRDIRRAYEQIPFNKRDGEIGGPELPEVLDLTEDEVREEDDAARRGFSKDLVWIQDQVLQYLCSDFNVTARQTEDSIKSIADGLQDYGLTKAELLQACNLAPDSHVGLYLIIEEAENRLQQPYDETISTILNDVIAPTLLPEVPEYLQPYVTQTHAQDIAQTIMEDAAAYAEEDEEMMYQEEEFVHEAEWGADKEGGVDDEEDNTME